jgi:hypothetical protein
VLRSDVSKVAQACTEHSVYGPVPLQLGGATSLQIGETNRIILEKIEVITIRNRLILELEGNSI